VEEAHRLAADAIAVQLNLNAQGLSHAIHAVSLTIGDAGFYDLPVLLMVTAAVGGNVFEAVVDALRISTELGADVVKIALPSEVFTAGESQLTMLRKAIDYSPPVVLAGGERRDDFDGLMAIAQALGFSGTCIGRNVFQHGEPKGVLDAAAAAFVGKERPN
jgi:class I fructose-bisphosphate aldolase